MTVEIYKSPNSSNKILPRQLSIITIPDEPSNKVNIDVALSEGPNKIIEVIQEIKKYNTSIYNSETMFNINLEPGTYDFNTSSINIISNSPNSFITIRRRNSETDPVIFNFNNNSNGIWVRAYTTLILENITIINSGLALANTAGVLVDRHATVNIDSCVIDQFWTGIFTLSHSKANINECLITDTSASNKTLSGYYSTDNSSILVQRNGSVNLSGSSDGKKAYWAESGSFIRFNDSGGDVDAVSTLNGCEFGLYSNNSRIHIAVDNPSLINKTVDIIATPNSIGGANCIYSDNGSSISAVGVYVHCADSPVNALYAINFSNIIANNAIYIDGGTGAFGVVASRMSYISILDAPTFASSIKTPAAGTVGNYNSYILDSI